MQTIDPQFLLANYDALLIDAYGVLVDAHGVLQGAPAFIRSLQSAGMPFCIVTNDAGKSLENIAARFARLDLNIAASQIVSSASLLPAYLAANDLVGKQVVVLGPADAAAFVREGGALPLPIEAARAPDVAAIVACDISGDMHQALAGAINLAIAQVDSGAPPLLVLCNPDVIYPAGSQFGLTSGALMLVLEGALRTRYQPADMPRIDRLGKPFAAIFEAAKRKTGGQKLALLGDQLPTDVRGALDFGIDAVLVGTGLTKVRPGQQLSPSPTFYLPAVSH